MPQLKGDSAGTKKPCPEHASLCEVACGSASDELKQSIMQHLGGCATCSDLYARLLNFEAEGTPTAETEWNQVQKRLDNWLEHFLWSRATAKANGQIAEATRTPPLGSFIRWKLQWVGLAAVLMVLLAVGWHWVASQTGAPKPAEVAVKTMPDGPSAKGSLGLQPFGGSPTVVAKKPNSPTKGQAPGDKEHVGASRPPSSTEESKASEISSHPRSPEDRLANPPVVVASKNPTEVDDRPEIATPRSEEQARPSEGTQPMSASPVPQAAPAADFVPELTPPQGSATGLDISKKGTALPERKKRVAVFDFDYATVMGASQAYFGQNVDLGKGISDLLVRDLVQNGAYSVIDRKTIEKVLAEQKFSDSDRADPNFAAKSRKTARRGCHHSRQHHAVRQRQQEPGL